MNAPSSPYCVASRLHSFPHFAFAAGRMPPFGGLDSLRAALPHPPDRSGRVCAMSEALKRQAAAMALSEVRPGMRLGLGTGSTARHFVDLLGEKVAAGLDGICVAPS